MNTTTPEQMRASAKTANAKPELKLAPNPPPAPTPSPAPRPAATATAIQHPIPATVDQLLVEILAWPRKHDTNNERLFGTWLRKRFEAAKLVVKMHSEGAMSVTVPHLLAPSTTLFSCHIDTQEGDCPVGTTKKLAYDANFGEIILDVGSPGGCLGADDGAGIWLMLNMIDAGVPGTYLFHRGEECGGISAKAIAAKEKDWLKQFECAVAFDRPRDNEIITHQGGAECASDKFAQALCAALNAQGMDYKPSDRGVYTDTKEYRKIVAECINIGVGYEGQHGKQESQDYAHLSALLKAALAVNWDALPVDRDPSKAVDAYPRSWGKGFEGYADAYKGYHGGYQRTLADDAEDDRWQSTFDKAKADTPKWNGTKLTAGEEALAEMEGMSLVDIEWLCEANASDAALAMAELMRQNAKLRADVATLTTLLGL